MNNAVMVIFLLFGIPLMRVFAKDYMRGLRLAILLIVCMPNNLVYELPGDLPNVTIQRFFLIVVFYFWAFRRPPERRGPVKIPFLGAFFTLAVAQVISVLLSVDAVTSVKDFLSFTVEILLFYVIAATSIRGMEDVAGVLRAIWRGLWIVAALAFVEYYTGFNPMDNLVPGYVRSDRMAEDIMSTYPHRILLGVAMAMAWPLGLALHDAVRERKRRLLRLFFAMMPAAACYFAMSRGPWMASALAAIIMGLGGSKGVRQRLAVLGLLVGFVMIVRPGVWDSVYNLSASTFDDSTLKGSSYQYRWELWRKAYEEVKKSTVRTLFGYGQGTSMTMDLRDVTTYSGKVSAFWSWDNQYAGYLLETGFLGLTLMLILLGRAYLGVMRGWWRSPPSDRALMAGVWSGVSVMLFMMSNVWIFAPQLNYLMWTLIALAMRYQSFRRNGDTLVAVGTRTAQPVAGIQL